jgi:hypothetical protein
MGRQVRGAAQDVWDTTTYSHNGEDAAVVSKAREIQRE